MALKALNSVAGFSVGEVPANVIYGNGDINAANLVVTSKSNLNSVSNVIITGGGAGYLLSTDGLGNLSFIAPPSTSGITNGTSNVSIPLLNGNVTINVNGTSNVGLFTQTSLDMQANINPAQANTYQLGNATNRWNNVFANTANIAGNIAAGGLLTNNLYYANGNPWDLQEAAGNNNEIQYNINDNFAASANFTYNDTTQLLTVLGNSQFNNANLGNLAIANFVNVASNITTSNLTVNLELAGNTANFSGNIKALNSNLGNLATSNFANIASNIITSNLTVNLELAGNTANFSGNINSLNANLGNLATANFITGTLTTNAQPNITSLGTLTSLTMGGNIIPSANVTYSLGNSTNRFKDLYVGGSSIYIGNVTLNVAGDDLTVIGNINSGNANLGNLLLANFANITSNIIASNLTLNLELSGNTANFTGNITSLNANLGNLATANYINVAQAINGNIANFTGNLSANLLISNFANIASNTITSNLTVNLELAGNTANFSGNITSLNANLGNLATANYVNVSQQINGNVANFSGNITSLNANLGNLATANYVNVSQQINGNVANFSGNITSLNANLGNLATANYVNVANDLTVIGNITAGNIIGPLANGNSNVRVYGNSNVEISINGTSNIATFTDNRLIVVGNINSSTGNIIANGNLIANNFVVAANANVTGEAVLGSVLTSNITAPVGIVTISAAGVDQNIILNPTGNGTVDVGLHKITQVGGPTNPSDAATKEYVDNTTIGLTIHNPVRVTSTTNLNATYANGGSVLTTIAISSNKTIQFSAAHGLSIGDEIAWDNSFNNIVGDDPYFVYSTPGADTITVKAGYFGIEVTTLTNGTGLSQTARSNTGVGATLTNAGANATISIDSVVLSTTNRVLIQGQTNKFENGVYTVTTVGAPDSPGPGSQWVLTRASDENTYSPKSTSSLGYGDYFFVQQGVNNAGSSYAVTSPVGEILFGLTNIEFSQFSAGASYTAGNGINITGTIISANTDGVTTDIVGGNIVVKSSANLTTPNIGDATFSSLSWNTLSNGNITANNLSIGNIANITGNLTVSGNIQANYAISSNANVSGNNINSTNIISAAGNVIGANVTANATIFSVNANISGNTITNALTVNNAITANTANFSGNVILPNITVNLALAGNTANFIGNVIVPNLTVNLELQGNTANFDGNVVMDNWLTVANTANVGNLRTDNLLYANGTPWDLQQAAGSNTQIQYNDGSNNFGASANLTFNYSTNQLYVNGTANIADSVILGNSTISTVIHWDSTTTSSVSANQTISSISTTGVTGLEFLVKGVDSAGGGKYSVATVQAVTDGTTVDYSVYGTVNLGGSTGTLAVNISGGFVRLQVTPASSNSTVWTTQVRTI